MRKLTTVLAIALPTYSFSTIASGWETFGEHGDLKGHYIADVGQVSEVYPPYGVKWSKKVYELNGRCFTVFGYLSNHAALLLVNERKDTKIASFSTSLSSIKVNVEPITLIKCPTGSDVVPYSDDPEERLRLLKEKQKELELRLKSFPVEK